MSKRLDWERDGLDWPHRRFSRFVTAGGLRWHVQVMGQGPAILLVHGTGAATHSFRALAPLLAAHCTVVSLDLPGHGFSGEPASPSGYSLPGVARGVAALLREIGVQPALVVGHSAGAAIVTRMVLDGTISPVAIASLNGALLPFPGIAFDFFRPAARFLASSPLTAKAFSVMVGSSGSAERLLRATGSRIEPDGVRLYARLTGNPGHVHGALALMANWDLHTLANDLPRLKTKLMLIAGSRDGMVPPSESYRVRSLVPTAELITLRDAGHLAHEEKANEIAVLLERLISVETVC